MNRSRKRVVRWSTKDVQQLKKLARAGETYKVIAKKLKRTQSAVAQYASNAEKTLGTGNRISGILPKSRDAYI